MIHIMMDINEHQDQRYTRGDNNGRDLYLLGVNVLVVYRIGETGASPTPFMLFSESRARLMC